MDIQAAQINTCMEHGERIARLEGSVETLVQAVAELTKAVSATHDSLQVYVAFFKGMAWFVGILFTIVMAVAGLVVYST